MSKPSVIIDTGALLAILHRADQHHEWASAAVRSLVPPFLTSEPVLTETLYMLQKNGLSIKPVFELLAGGAILIPFDLAAEAAAIQTLMEKYRGLPKGQMSLADASLVRLAERYPDAAVFTLDQHFTIYRKNGRQKIRLISPHAA